MFLTYKLLTNYDVNSIVIQFFYTAKVNLINDLYIYLLVSSFLFSLIKKTSFNDVFSFSISYHDQK